MPNELHLEDLKSCIKTVFRLIVNHVNSVGKNFIDIVVQLLMMEECKFSSLTLLQVFSILLVFQLICAIQLKGQTRCVKIIHSTLSKKLDTTAWTSSREVRSVLERCPANISQNWSMKMTWKQQGQSIHVHFREPSVFHLETFLGEKNWTCLYCWGIREFKQQWPRRLQKGRLKVNLRCHKRYRAYSISFNLPYVGNFL